MEAHQQWLPRRQEAILLSACVQEITNRPLSEVTVKSIAEAAGLTVWAAHRAASRVARNREHLIRRAVIHLAEGVAAQVSAFPPVRPGVLATIEAVVAHMAEVMRSDDFKRLYRLVVCEGTFRPWLHALYERKVAAIFCARLEEHVRGAGAQVGTAIAFRDGAARATLRSLEHHLAVPPLLPRDEAPGDDRPVVRKIAQEAFAQTYAWGHLPEAAVA